MGWAIASVMGFAVVTGLVIALARSNTARWERNHRAAQAAVQTPDQPSVTARAAALLSQHVPEGIRHLPHPHVPHPHLRQLPHMHLPSWVVDRLPHPHLPHPHLHLPHVDSQRVRRLVHLPARRPGPDARPTEEDGESPPGA